MKPYVPAFLLLFTALPWAGAQPSQATSPTSTAVGIEDEVANAQELLAGGSIDAAISLARELVAQHPDNPAAHLLLGSALALVPRQTEALAALRRAVTLDPSFAGAHHTLGMALARFGQHEEAGRAFALAVEIDPEFAEAHANLGLILAQRGQFAEARGRLSRAVELRKDAPAAAYWHYLIGKTLREEGRPEEAAKHYEQATKLRPDYAEAYLALGLVRNLLRERPSALEALSKAVALAPNHAGARYELGKLLVSLGDAEQAVEQLRAADRLAPGGRSVLFALQRALRRIDQTEQADEVQARLKEVLRRDDRGRETALLATQRNNEAVEIERQGKLSAALEKYRQALELNPFHPGFRRNLGLVLCRLERWAEGIAELEEAARLDPEDEETTRALYVALDQAAAAKKAATASQ